MKYGKGSYSKLKLTDKNAALKLDLKHFKEPFFEWMHTGEFEDDEINGTGTLETKDDILSGYFFNGDLDGEFTLEHNS